MRSNWIVYGGSAAALVLALAVRVALDPVLGDSLVFSTTIAAVVVSVALGGWRVGAVVAALGYLLAHVLFLEPRGTIDFSRLETCVGALVYLATCASVIAIGEAMRRALAERGRMALNVRALADELAEADRRKNEFLATIAHELRHPLAPLSHTVEALKRTGAAPHMLAQGVATMERQLGQVVRLVDDLLDLSRITHDRMDLRKQDLDLRSVIEQALESCRPHAHCACHDMTISLPGQALPVHGDSTRLTQVFANLLNNACKYTPRGGRISIRADLEGADVVVTVADNGIGIPADRLETIFGMFEQLEHAADRSQGGLGIGLTLVRRLVEMHGGKVAATSDGYGTGSRFAVRLPLAKPSPAAIEPAPAQHAIAPTARRVLIVDDNEDAASSLGTLLSITGHQVHTAANGTQALELARTHRPDVMLLDIGLPDMDGLEVCRRIRSQPWGKDIRIAALTGWGREEDRRQSREAGFDIHLAKPVSLTALQPLFGVS